MTDLPRIAAPEPVVIDPLPTTYPDLFISDLRIKAEPGKPWRLSTVFWPYNYDAAVIQPESRPAELILGDVKAKAAQYPATVGMALGAVLQIAPLLLREQQLEARIAAAAVGEDVSALQAELSQVQAALTGA